MSVSVYSEIHPLKKVLLHRPGKEIERLTPELMQEFLFDDIPYLKVAREEHDVFSSVLSKCGAEVVYLDDLIKEVLKKDNDLRRDFIDKFIGEAGVYDFMLQDVVREYLYSLSLKKMIDTMCSGIHQEVVVSSEVRAHSMISSKDPFICSPMPNLYFTRDPLTCIANGISINNMHSNVRSREGLFIEYICQYHPDFRDVSTWYSRDNVHRIEGGDILILNESTLAIGISQRTGAEGIKLLARNLFADTEINTILAINIPKRRSFMHLDTVFTQVDYDCFTIHPEILELLTIYNISHGQTGDYEDLHIEQLEGSLEKILEKVLKTSVRLIKCGGGDEFISEREQWNDGTNTLAIAPGEVVVYARNYVTNEVLDKAGIKLNIIPSSELSRGRGGPRCMSMPLIRG